MTPRRSGGSASPVIALPSAPTDVATTAYADGWEIGWTPSADGGGATITSYTVTATPPSGPAATCTSWWDETSCVLPLADLTDGQTYDVDVVATTMFGDSPAGSPAVDPVQFVVGTDPAPVQVAATATIRDPDAIIDIRLTSSAPVSVVTAGYVAVPQGHVALDAGPTPAGASVRLMGGLVAGLVHLGTPPAVLDVEYDNPIAQKTMRIVSSADRASAVAIVQVNESGSFAVNSLAVS